MISSASICSVMRMVPISEAMFDPTLPERMSATTVEENSEDHGLARGVAHERARNEGRVEVDAHLQRDDRPMNTEMMAVRPIELSPSASISKRMRLR